MRPHSLGPPTWPHEPIAAMSVAPPFAGLFCAVSVPPAAITQFQRGLLCQFGQVVGIDQEICKVVACRPASLGVIGEQVIANTTNSVSQYQVGKPTMITAGVPIVPVAIDRATKTVFHALVPHDVRKLGAPLPIETVFAFHNAPSASRPVGGNGVISSPFCGFGSVRQIVAHPSTSDSTYQANARATITTGSPLVPVLVEGQTRTVSHAVVPDVAHGLGTSLPTETVPITGSLFAVLVPLPTIGGYKLGRSSQIGPVVGIDYEVGKIVVCRAADGDKIGEQVFEYRSSNVSNCKVGQPIRIHAGETVVPVAIDRTIGAIFHAVAARDECARFAQQSSGTSQRELLVGADGAQLPLIRFSLIAFDMDSTVSVRMISHFTRDEQSVSEYVGAFGGADRIALLRELFKVLQSNGVHFFILSNGAATHIKEALTVVGLIEFFSEGQVVGSDVLEFQQNNFLKGEVVRARLHRLGIPSDQALFIDDQVANLETATGVCHTYNPSVLEGLRIDEIQSLISLYNESPYAQRA